MFCHQCELFWKQSVSHCQVPANLTSSKDVRWAHQRAVLHRSMRELKRASDIHCQICRAILFTPTSYESESLLSDDDEALDIVLELDTDKGPQPILSVTFCEANAGKKIRIPKRMVAACASLVSNHDLVSTLERSARLDNDGTGTDAAFGLASFWLQQCLSEHESCEHQSSTLAHLRFVPTRLLDVSDDHVRLVETKDMFKVESDDRRYVSLSHCWGRIPIIRTLKENYEDHKKEINPAKLSKTFSDAVHATRKLDFRYIWIDSLCIIQDVTSDWEHEAVTMCDVYRNATFCIVAAHAPGGDIGCFYKRDGLLQSPFVIDLPQPDTSGTPPAKTHHILFTSFGRSQDLGGPEPPLYCRAWVLQEQLLSPRMLIFDGPQLRWECLSTHGSERSPLGGISRNIGHRHAIRTGLFNSNEFFDRPDQTDKDFTARTQLSYWFGAVADYTHRGMTQGTDRLVAIAGIAKALQQHSRSKYYAGLWEQFLWYGLLWSIDPEDEFASPNENAFNLLKNEHVRLPNILAPTWSWVSVTVPVLYPTKGVSYIQSICKILNTFVSGTSASQTGSLEVRGHIRTGYVDAFYPYSMREAAAAVPHMTCGKPSGSKQAVSITYRGRVIHPTDYFIFSDTYPSTSLHRLSGQTWRLVRGYFRPDEIIDPATQITFVAIAQWNAGTAEGSLVGRHGDAEPLEVWSLALVPTGRVDGEYRRVGVAVWEDCAWYGYVCGNRKRYGRDNIRAEGWRGWMAVGGKDQLGWYRDVSGGGRHVHGFKGGEMPLAERYHKDVEVEERVAVIV